MIATQSLAEGIADRRNENPDALKTDEMIERIHMEHGDTAAGPMDSMGAMRGKQTNPAIMHKNDINMPMHGTQLRYGSLRHQPEFQNLNAHQYKRRSVNNQ